MKGKASLARCPLSPICFLNLYRWFWNHIFTCVGERFISRANCSRSGAERYRCCLKRLSSSKICALENSTLRFRFLVLGISVSGSFSFSLLKSSTSSLSVESAKIKGRKMLKRKWRSTNWKTECRNAEHWRKFFARFVNLILRDAFLAWLHFLAEFVYVSRVKSKTWKFSFTCNPWLSTWCAI